MADAPFRITLYSASGEARKFPLHIDAARDNIKRSVRWKDAPFNAGILNELDNRDTLLQGSARLFAEIANRGEGVFNMADDDGVAWVILARSVTAVSVEDPEAKDRRRPAQVGFAFQSDRASVSVE